MPTGPKSQKRPADATANAVEAMRIATRQDRSFPADDGKDKAAQSLGQRGGKARAKSLTPVQRTQIARKAAMQRWAKR